MVKLTAEEFRLWANKVLQKDPNRSPREQGKDFACFYGVKPVVMADIWNRIDPLERISQKAQPKHLLWAFVFLRKYQDEKTHCRIVGIKDPKEFRHWCWPFVEAIADLEFDVVS